MTGNMACMRDCRGLSNEPPAPARRSPGRAAHAAAADFGHWLRVAGDHGTGFDAEEGTRSATCDERHEGGISSFQTDPDQRSGTDRSRRKTNSTDAARLDTGQDAYTDARPSDRSGEDAEDQDPGAITVSSGVPDSPASGMPGAGAVAILRTESPASILAETGPVEALPSAEAGSESGGPTSAEAGSAGGRATAPQRDLQANTDEGYADPAGMASDGDADSQDGLAMLRTAAPPPEHPIELARSLKLLDMTEMLDPGLGLDAHPGISIAHLGQEMNGATVPVTGEAGSEVVMPQVIRGLVTLVRDGAAEMRLQLQPPDLGEIELRVRTSEGSVRSEMIVQQAELRELLYAGMDRLREALAQEGLDLAGFDVDVERDTHSGGSTLAGEPRTSGRQTDSKPETTGSGMDTTTEASVDAAAVQGKPSIDYTI